MADSTRRIFCRTCGKEIDIYSAKSYFTGKSMKYECFECQKKGNSMAENFRLRMIDHIRKEMQ